MLEKEFQYYLDHQEDLVKQYANKHIVIKDCKVVGSYNDAAAALAAAKEKFEIGTFLIQHCVSGKDSYTQTYHSRVVF